MPCSRIVLFAVWILQRVIAHGKQETPAPGIEINGRKGLFDKRIVFMPAVVEGYIVTIIGINSGKGNDGSAQITPDVFDNGIRTAEIGFGINVKIIFVFMIYFRFVF